MEYFKEHNKWNDLKKILDYLSIPVPFQLGEIWWASLGHNIGIEMDGKGIEFERPVLILKKFNKDHAWIVPITHSKEIEKSIHKIINHQNLDSNSAVVITQLKTISAKRLLRRIGIINQKRFQEIRESVKNMV